MTITDREVAVRIGRAVRFPSISGLVLPRGAEDLATYIAAEVAATEKPSLLSGTPIDNGIRRQIVARRLTQAALDAEEFGEKEEEKRRSRPKIPKPLPN